MAKKLYIFTLYETDGTKRVSVPRKEMSYEELRAAVEGSIETVPPGCYKHHGTPRATAYCNDEGLMNGMERNPHFLPFMGNIIHGPVIKREVYKPDIHG
jgi:hypothetical protein